VVSLRIQTRLYLFFKTDNQLAIIVDSNSQADADLASSGRSRKPASEMMIYMSGKLNRELIAIALAA
jgi:hypothetical protein